MNYMDEEILRQQKQENKTTDEPDECSIQGSVIEKKIIIEENEYLFEEKTFLNGCMKIYMPNDLREMTEEEINAAYIMGNKPQYLYTSDSLGLSFVINHTTNPLADAQVHAMASYAGMLLEKSPAGAKVYKKNKIEKNNKIISTLEVISNGFDDSVYTLNYYASLNHRLLLGNISFGMRRVKYLRTIVSMMMDTMEIYEEV